MWWKLSNAISPILLRENYMEQLSTFNIYISLSRETYCAISGHPTTLPIQSYWQPFGFLLIPTLFNPVTSLLSALGPLTTMRDALILITCFLASLLLPSRWIVPIALTWSGVSLSHSHHLPGLTTSPGFDFIRSCLPSRFVNANLKPQRASVSDRVCSTKRWSPFLLNPGCSFCWRTKTISPVTWLYPDAKHQTYSFSQWCSK